MQWLRADNQQTLQNAEQQAVDLRLVLRTIREMTDIQKLTPTLVNSLIERIEVYNNDKSSGQSRMAWELRMTKGALKKQRNDLAKRLVRKNPVLCVLLHLRFAVFPDIINKTAGIAVIRDGVRGPKIKNFWRASYVL